MRKEIKVTTARKCYLESTERHQENLLFQLIGTMKQQSSPT